MGHELDKIRSSLKLEIYKLPLLVLPNPTTCCLHQLLATGRLCGTQCEAAKCCEIEMFVIRWIIAGIPGQ